MNLEEWKESGIQLIKALRARGEEEAFRRLLSDLYPDTAHFIYELFQNAEDAKAELCNFTLSDSSLEFEHNGTQLFSEDNVKSITSFGNSTKRDDPTSIGKFGVGFKAVFAYTNTPEIHSGKFHFRIHDLVVPETDGVPLPQMGDRETRFVFPFDNQKKPQVQAAQEVERGLRSLGDNTLLFLANIRKIEYLLPDSSIGTLERIEREGGHIEIRTTRPGGEDTVSSWLRFEKDVVIMDEDGKPKKCRIAIAYSLAEDGTKKGPSTWKIVPLNNGQVSIYFPAEKEASNLRFHLHAPFASTVARDSLRDCKANHELRNHLADLVVESLGAIRDRGLLTVGFLAVLPNPQDNLSAFYEPIRQAIIKAFKNDNFTPTRSGTHAPASRLYRGPASIQEVLEDEGLSQLTQDRSRLGWAKNPFQENQREARFLDSLDIDAWGWRELTDELWKLNLSTTFTSSHQGDNQRKLVENWIAQKDDVWLLRFYALLGEAHDKQGGYFTVDNLCIIRVTSDSGNQHVSPKKAYFPPEKDAKVLPSDILFVKASVYADGRSEPQKKFAKLFLGFAGVRLYDETATIERILKQYGLSGPPISLNTHINHVSKFVNHWQNDQNSVATFKGIAFLLAEGETGDKQYFKASDLYLDSPYVDTGLGALFSDKTLSIEKPKRAVSTLYSNDSGINNCLFTEFATAIGTMRRLEMCTYKATEMQREHFPKKRKETSSTVDQDYFINGIHWLRENSGGYIGNFDLGMCKSLPLSRAIWSLMCNSEPTVLVARYFPNEKHRHEEKIKPSFIVEHLAKSSWMPDKDGKFMRPAEISMETLHPAFKFDDRNGWLTAIGFGGNAKRRTEEYQIRNRAAQNLGFASADEANEFARLKSEGVTPTEIRTLLAQRKPTEQPKQSVPDPERRRKNVLANAADAPNKESVQRERSIQKGLSEIVAQAKAYLRAKYKNSANQLVCQCCRKEPFKLKSGAHYFEAVQCTDDKETRHYQNRLALCPTCAAMYQYARETDDTEIRRLIVDCPAEDQAPSIEIPIRLAGQEHTLRFVGSHWFDLKTVLSNS